MRRPSLTLGLAFLILASPVAPACAWKPNAHVFAVNLALKDALADSKVTNRLFDDIPVNPMALSALHIFQALPQGIDLAQRRA